MRFLCRGLGLALLVAWSALARADVTIYDEDFGDKPFYPDGSQALRMGDITNQNPYCYDTFAHPPKGKVFYEVWDATQGKGEIVDIGGNHGRVLQVWHTGRDEEWGKAVHNTFMAMFRPTYNLPLVVEFKFRPADYDPHPTMIGPYVGAAEDPSYGYKEVAARWRFYLDDPTEGGGGYRMKYILYYDGTLWQSFRTQGIPGSENPGPVVDVGGKDAGPADIWNPASRKWLEYRLVHDPAHQEIRIYLTNEDRPLHRPFLDENGNDLDRDKVINAFTIRPGNNGLAKDENVKYLRFRQFGELQGGCDQSAAFVDGHYRGDADQDGSKVEYDDIHVYYPGTPANQRRITGTFTVAYPYWCYYKFENLEWQLRPPAKKGRPQKPLLNGTDDFHLWSASKAVKEHSAYPADGEPNVPVTREYVVGMVAPGTYDLAFKHRNHLAVLISNLAVAADADATGINFTILAGDAGADFINHLDEADNPVINSDNDCDSWDLKIVNAELDKGPLGVTGRKYAGTSGDFDGDGKVTTWDKAGVEANQGKKGGAWYVEDSGGGRSCCPLFDWFKRFFGKK